MNVSTKPPAPEAEPKPTAVDEDRPYNPFEHRDAKKTTTSNFGALAHLLKTSLGSGILAMPMAFKNAGLVFGVVGSIFLGIVCAHCVQILVKCSQVLCVRHRVPVLTYTETAEKAFLNGPPSAQKSAHVMGILVTIQLLGSFTLGCTVYVVFIAETLRQICMFFWNVQIHTRFFILMLWIPLILMCLLPNLKSLVPFSVVANVLVFISCSIVVYYIVKDVNEPETVHLIASADRWPVFLSTLLFAIEGIGSAIPIENEMKHPENFIGGRFKIVHTALAIVIFIYSVIGFLGYLEYGEDTKGSITLNLPVEEALGQSVKLMIALAIFFTYALQFYVPINIIYTMLQKKMSTKRPIVVHLIVRVVLVSLTIIIGLIIPKLEPVIGMVGAIAFSTLGLLMPALIDTMTYYPNFGRCKWRLVKNIFISILSIVALVSGFIVSLYDAIDMYKTNPDP